MHTGQATTQGTGRYATRFPTAEANQFYRRTQELTVSSLGIGTYLGGLDSETDQNYTQAVIAAVRGGINFIDTSLNYRNQRSERSIGSALDVLLADAGLRRDEVVVCTKAGFLVPNAVPSDQLAPGDIVANMHSMAPAFLQDQLERSRQNLGLETIDVFYLHNPESQLRYVDRGEFDARIRRAFETAEALAAQGRIQWYGAATWDGFRKADGLSLARMLELAREAGGANHRFRFIQLPFNLGMVEALEKRDGADGVRRSVLETAGEAGITVVASATLLQSRLTSDLPEALTERLPGPVTDAQRAIQFTRSTPGIAVALVGTSSAAHVAGNLGVAGFPPATPAQFAKVFEAAG